VGYILSDFSSPFKVFLATMQLNVYFKKTGINGKFQHNNFKDAILCSPSQQLQVTGNTGGLKCL
jgi:hypothetical protein